jgi:5-formyltetrahydrofolate cyclo-ligase
MGWGYYDRILSRRLNLDAPSPLLVGVCHDCQLVEQVPTESHDVTMDVVVTNETLIDITHETSHQDVDER